MMGCAEWMRDKRLLKCNKKATLSLHRLTTVKLLNVIGIIILHELNLNNLIKK